MLRVHCHLPSGEVEPRLRAAAQHHAASVLHVTHLGHLQRYLEQDWVSDVVIFTVTHAAHNAALMQQDPRFACFLPWRIVARPDGAGSVIEMFTPLEACTALGAEDARDTASRLEKVLHEIIEAVASPHSEEAEVSSRLHPGMGAMESQVTIAATVPQKIDRIGTKLEDIAGTGQHEAPGG